MPHTPLHADDFKTGQLVTIHSYKEREIDCPQCHEKHKVTPPNNEYCGQPFRILAINLPYIAAVYVGTQVGQPGTPIQFDVRQINLMEISVPFARARGAVIPKRVKKPKQAPATPVVGSANPFADFMEQFFGPNVRIVDLSQIHQDAPEPAVVVDGEIQADQHGTPQPPECD